MLVKCAVEKAAIAAIQKQIAAFQKKVNEATGIQKQQLLQQLHEFEVEFLDLEQELKLCLAHK